jgi:hypothetical protein
VASTSPLSAHPHAVLVAHVGLPDSALGIDADPVWMVPGVSAHTRRSPSAPMSYAVSRFAYDSATIRLMAMASPAGAGRI